MKPVYLFLSSILFFANCQKNNSEETVLSVPTDYSQMEMKQYTESQADILNPNEDSIPIVGSLRIRRTLSVSDIQKYRQGRHFSCFTIYY